MKPADATKEKKKSPQPITVPIRHLSRLAEEHTISSAAKRVKNVTPRDQSPAESCGSGEAKEAGPTPSPLLYSITASSQRGDIHVTPPKDYVRETEPPLLPWVLIHCARKAVWKELKRQRAISLYYQYSGYTECPI